MIRVLRLIRFGGGVGDRVDRCRVEWDRDLIGDRAGVIAGQLIFFSIVIEVDWC